MIVRNFRSFIAFLILVLLIEWGGHTMTFVSVQDWYLTLKKPDWTPPSWVFGPVWTILYFSIAVSGWLVWIKAPPSRRKIGAFCVYGAQLSANLAWSYFFFFLKSPIMGLMDIVLLLILTAINIALFIRLYKRAGLWLIPYFFWTLYAFFLNVSIWMMNR